jgi:hypothetical protein
MVFTHRTLGTSYLVCTILEAPGKMAGRKQHTRPSAESRHLKRRVLPLYRNDPANRGEAGRYQS